MLCHICGEPAVGQCQNCNLYYCPRHGRVFCTVCKGGEQVAAGPPPWTEKAPEAERVSTAPLAPDGEKGVRLRCFHCGQPTDRVCGVCGSAFCGAHRGWRAVRIGRYTMRRVVCDRCAGAPSWLKLQTKWLIAWVLILVALAIYWLLGVY